MGLKRPRRAMALAWAALAATASADLWRAGAALAAAADAAADDAAADAAHDGWEAGWDPGDDANFGAQGDGYDDDDDDDDDEGEMYDDADLERMDRGDEVLENMFAKQALDPGDLAGYDFENGMESGGLDEASTFEAELETALRETIPADLRVNLAAVEALDSLEAASSFAASLEDPELVGGCVLGLFALKEAPPRVLPTQKPESPNVVLEAWNEFIEASEDLVQGGHRFAFSLAAPVLAHFNVTSWAIVVVQPPMFARAEHGDPLQAKLPASDGSVAPERAEISDFVRTYAFPTVMLITYENEDAIERLARPVLTIYGNFDREKTPSLISDNVDMLGRVAAALGNEQVMLTLANRALDASELRFFSAELACLKSERTTEGKMCATLRIARGEYYRMDTRITEDNLVAFVRSVLAGEGVPAKLAAQAKQAASGSALKFGSEKDDDDDDDEEEEEEEEVQEEIAVKEACAEKVEL